MAASIAIDIECVVCFSVMRDAVMLNNGKEGSVEPCGHLFCEICIGKQLAIKEQCPTCRQETKIQHLVKATSIRREIAQMAAPCEFQDKGCIWRGSYGAHHGNLLNHLQTCTFRGKACDDCKTLVSWDDWLKHDAVCLLKPTACTLHKDCGKMVPRQDMAKHIEECIYRPASCPYAEHCPPLKYFSEGKWHDGMAGRACHSIKHQFQLEIHLEEYKVEHLSGVHSAFKNEQASRIKAMKTVEELQSKLKLREAEINELKGQCAIIIREAAAKIKAYDEIEKMVQAIQQLCKKIRR